MPRMAIAGYSTPMLHVRSIERSIDFYRLLGFNLIDTGGCEPLEWARMHCEDGSAVMFLRAEEPDDIDPEKQAIMLALYADDLPTFREHMISNGVPMPEIEHPAWMPSGHLFFRDPDEYRIGVNHWSVKEHQAWLKKLEEKRAKNPEMFAKAK
jgi:catechol 2,3-dioxygenase-like lactoylglutathione lyase family enzyme